MASKDRPSSRHIARKPSDADRYVGQQVRQARQELGLTQEDVAERLGVTFQQVQKYESGGSRLSAGRLRDIAITLHKPIDFFYEPFDVEPVASNEAGQDLRRRTLHRELKHLVELVRDIEQLEALKRVLQVFVAANA